MSKANCAIEVQILGETWKVFLLDEDEFQKRFKEVLAGFTDLSYRQIFINESEFNEITVVHELVHAFFSYTCTEAASLTLGQMEEVFCEVFAKHGASILRLGKEVMKGLKK